MKYTKKIAALLMAVSMVFSSSGVAVLAEDQSTSQIDSAEVQGIGDAETTDDQNTEQNVQSPDEPTADDVTADATADAETTTDEAAGEIQSENQDHATELQRAFDYVYVDEQTVNIPEEQNIVVAFADSALVLESAVLHYSMSETGAAYDTEASNIAANAVLFTKSYTDASETGTYQLDSITYRISGQEEDVTVSFAEQEIQAGYTVTTEPEPEEQTVEEEVSSETVPEITVYSIDEEGNAVSQSGDSDTVEDVVEETFAAVDEEAAVLSGETAAMAVSENTIADTAGSSGKARIASVQNEDKVIVICAGHDATHVGASGNGLNEYELTWKVANYCKEELERYDGVTVYLDRSTVNCAYPGKDTSYCLNQRVKDAAEKGASVFVDIHFNVVNGVSTTANGAEVYVPNNSYSTAIHEDGENLGNHILEQLVALGLTDRGVKVRDCTDGTKDENGILEDYYTTNSLSKKLGMTGVIVEHAFLDNAGDAAKLKNESFIKQLGVADAAGIANAYGLTKGTGTKNPKITISDKDDFAGTATIKISGAGANGSAAIWSEVNGQDDLKWTEINGSGTIQFNIKDYKNSRGTYNIHLYDNHGSGKCLLTTTFRVSADTSGTINITNVNGEDKQFKVTLTFKDMPQEVTKVEFPTWSESNGQDDIVWYSAKQTSSGVWEATVPISSHKSTGTYNVHAYATINGKTQKMVKAATFTVSKPTISSVKAQNYNADEGTFDVVLSGVTSKSGVSKVQVPVWSKSDQSDIVWYDALKQSDGTYKVTVDIANHKNNIGTYNIHTYLTAGNGVFVFTGKTTQNVTTAGNVKVSAQKTSSEEMSYALNAVNVNKLGNCSSLQFAVWSDKDGQDDLVWYDARKITNGTWTATADITRHKTAGTYYVHAYGIFNGKSKYIQSTTFEVSKPEIASINIENYNKNNGTFDVVLSGVSSVSEIKKIEIPVWSASDQNDIEWYSTKKQSDGTYKANVSIANHKYNIGIYNIHAYVTTKNGVIAFAGGTTHKIVIPDIKTNVKDIDGKETTYSMTINNVDFFGKCSEISFAVWSEKDGQDDLIWYKANKEENGSWRATADISRHKTEGRYFVHVYGTYDGVQRMIDDTTFTVSTPEIDLVEVQNYNESAGTFEVLVSGVNSASGISQVQVPVWSASDQSDIKWYTALKQSGDTYKAKINISNHKNNVGIYNIHVYVKTGNGLFKFAGSTTQKVTIPDMEISATDTDGKETTYSLKVKNTDFFGMCSELNFAVWSENNGQDDLIWYPAVKTGSGSWSATADITRHKTSGKYQVHVYGTYADIPKFLGSVTFTVNSPTISSVEAQNYDETTGTFEVIVTGITSKSGIEKVQIPVWCKSDQSDIVWYDASRQSDGTYRVEVDTANHQNHTGVYNIHIYITTKNGIFMFVGKTTQAVAFEKEPIIGKTTTTVEQMVRFFNTRAIYPAEELEKGGAPDIETFCKIYIEEAEAEGVRAEVAFAQAMKETGFLKYGGIVKIEQFNFAGLGAVDGNSNGECASFPDVRTGVRAHVQHLKAYATTDALNNKCVDPRYNLVSKGCAKYVQWLGIQENPLGKGWASEKNYGYSIVNDYMKLLLAS